jgi:hypothetical protein
MLIAISITLVMMAVVVGVFATLSESVSKRRSAIEVGTQLRHVRNVLQRDLEGATCPVIPWQRPESDVGYFEIVEGPYSDFRPSLLTDGQPVAVNNPEIDHAISTIPSSNLNFTATAGRESWVTDGGGLGDYDDVLAFTSRNEKEPFTGPAPRASQIGGGNSSGFANWGSETISSPVAEVVWFCVENPATVFDPPTPAERPFGEAGFRTIYRRTLLVAPWLDYKFNVDGNSKSRPGVLRILPNGIGVADEDRALAALIAFQERYDISARIQFDPTIGNNGGRWTIVANTLADLTDRKNRFEHHGYVIDGGNAARRFPFVMVSKGVVTPGSNNTTIVPDQEASSGQDARAQLVLNGNTVIGTTMTNVGTRYTGRPFVAIEGGGTARAMVDEGGRVVHVTTGLVPLGVTGERTSRRGADLMLADALGFDVQVFDPSAPVYALDATGRVIRRNDTRLSDPNLDFIAVGPGSAGWWPGFAQYLSVNVPTPNPSSNDNPLVVREGAYADLGYAALQAAVNNVTLPAVALSTLAGPPKARSLPADNAFTRVYDTWNFGYENDGVNQDLAADNGNTNMVDEGTNGFDDPSWYDADGDGAQDDWVALHGPDDPAERETSPPYPVPLRAVQVKLRAYEPDSRQMREVTVRQHFVPE